MSATSRFKHDCVLYIDRWQKEELGKVTVTNQYVEFTSDDNHLILEGASLEEVRIEQDIVRILDDKQHMHFLRFLLRPPHRKWFSPKTHYDDDEPSSRQFVSVVHSIIRSKKAGSTVKEKVVIREVVLTPCKYCGGLMPQAALFCPECGARKK